MTSLLNLAILALVSLWTQVQSDECPKRTAITEGQVNNGHEGPCLICDERNCYYESSDGTARPILRVPN